MPKKVDILSKEEVFKKAFFRIEKVRLRHELYNGEMSRELTRLNFNRGDSVAALIHQTDDDTLILTEQFRYPAYVKGEGWLVEVPAGTVEEGEEPVETMHRELEEEIGYRTDEFRHIHTFFVSPGGTSERIHLFYARVESEDKISKGGGVPLEGEDIRALIISVDDALEMLEEGKIMDAKTLIALQWLKYHRDDD